MQKLHDVVTPNNRVDQVVDFAVGLGWGAVGFIALCAGTPGWMIFGVFALFVSFSSFIHTNLFGIAFI